MKVRFANNQCMIEGDMEIGPEEVFGKMGIEMVAKLSTNGITIATEIFKKYPEIKQVTLDTMTDEERALIEVAKSNIIKN